MSFGQLRQLLADCAYLYVAGAPATVLLQLLSWQPKVLAARYSPQVQSFRALLREKRFSTDWFTINIPAWLSTFESLGLNDRPLKILEIGSWEGCSSLFFLTHFPHAHLTCVDTWEGADEHSESPLVKRIEEHFDSNMLGLGDRLTKFRGKSSQYFATTEPSEEFDVIYVDGSHYFDDVLLDAIKSLEALKVGGLLIFEDYLWREYRDRKANPASAINAFLKLKARQIRVVLTNHQIIFQRTASADKVVL
jgi:predicted O-methyltransferase YrrM